MHKREIRELMCAMLLGDSSLRISESEGHTSGVLWTEHSRNQQDYLLWKASELDKIFKKKNLSRRCKIYTRDRFDKRTNKTYYSCLSALNWKQYLSFIYPKIYKIEDGKPKKKVKFLLKNISIDKHLAIWFMDDVSESRTKKKHKDGTEYWGNPYFRLGTYCFTTGECQLIKEWFNKNYEVNPSINQYVHGPILQFSVNDSKKLFPHIRPYVVQLESMKLKFRLCLERY